MRISDWSSDVCSSDLASGCAGLSNSMRISSSESQPARLASAISASLSLTSQVALKESTLGRVSLDRKSVVLGKSVSVRVDLGGRRIIKKKNKTTTSIDPQLSSNTHQQSNSAQSKQPQT